MANVSVGLVLRPHLVEVVEVKRAGRGVAITKHARVPVESGEEEQIIAACTAAIRALHAETARIGVTIPAQDVLLRSFSLPHLPKAEWTNAVQFEARKYIPFKIDELMWGYYAIEDRATKQIAVTFAGVLTETFTRMQQRLKGAGVQPAFIEAPWVSLARLTVLQPKNARERCVGIVEIEGALAHIVIVKDGVPCLARDVSLASMEGFDAGSASAAIDPRAEKLFSDLRLSVDFFSREHPDVSLSRLLLFGNDPSLPAWSAWLATQVSFPVGVGLLSTEPGQETMEAVDAGFALAVGVALRDLHPTSMKLDFLERKVATAVAASSPLETLLGVRLDPTLVRALTKTVLIQLAAALVGLGALMVVGQQQLDAARQKVAQAQQAFPDPGWGLKQKSQEDLEALQTKSTQSLAMVRKTMQQRVLVSEKLSRLAQMLPEGIWLEGVTYQDHLERLGVKQTWLTIRGACVLPQEGNELDVINEFVQQIKQDPVFSQGLATVQLANIVEAGDAAKSRAYRTFEITCRSEADAKPK